MKSVSKSLNITSYLLAVVVLLFFSCLFDATTVYSVDQETRRRWNKQQKELYEIYNIKRTPGVYKLPYATHPFQWAPAHSATELKDSEKRSKKERKNSGFRFKDPSNFSEKNAIRLLKKKHLEFLKLKGKYERSTSSSKRRLLSNRLYLLQPFEKGFSSFRKNRNNDNSKNNAESFRQVAIDAVKENAELTFMIDLIEIKPHSKSHQRLVKMLVNNQEFQPFWLDKQRRNENLAMDLAMYKDKYKSLKREIIALTKYLRYLSYLKLFDKRAYRNMSNGVDKRIRKVKADLRILSDDISQQFDKDEEPDLLFP